jgi:predicted dienelactone hydrolase
MKIFLLCSVAAFLTPAFAAVGFQQLSVPDPPGKSLSVAVWFPSRGNPVSVSLGPFQQTVIPDGVITGTGLPLVLISHGTGGSSASHYDTALALADEGFVVAALTHTGDNYMDQSYAGNRKDLTDRPRQIGVLLSYMLTNWTKHDRLDAGRIGLFGFSLGGFTTLVEIGGTPDLSRMRELCAIHPTAPECLFVKQRNGNQLSPETFTPAWPHERVKAAVIAAPAVSYLFGPGSLKAVRIPIQLWRASNDDQAPDAWNTALIRQELPRPPEEHVVTHAGHYAFLPPCSEQLAQQAPQICTDNPSFDRARFHREFNEEVVAFFKKTLIA